MNKLVFFGIILGIIGSVLFWCQLTTSGTALLVWFAGALFALGGFMKEAVQKRNCF